MYCKGHGVRPDKMSIVLKDEFDGPQSIPGYVRCSSYGAPSIGCRCTKVYEDFKRLCDAGRQPGTFKSYCHQHGITKSQMSNFLQRKGLRVAGLPGYKGPPGTSCIKCIEVPFENVIFEEAGFLPAESGNVITVKVDGHVAVSFPADTDVAVIARFVRKMGKEAGDVGA